MKSPFVVAAIVSVALTWSPSYAQVQAGPLTDPSAAPAPKPAKTKHPTKAHARKTTASSSQAQTAPIPPTDAAPSSLPTSHADRKAVQAPTDPVSLGLKWNGNNDTGERTRVQNYDGNAAGTGAAVGLNLHF